MNNVPLITIVAGVVVFAASQYVLKLILEPIVELKKTITSISMAWTTSSKTATEKGTLR